MWKRTMYLWSYETRQALLCTPGEYLGEYEQCTSTTATSKETETRGQVATWT